MTTAVKQIEDFHGANLFLSNFYLCPIEFEGTVYKSVEHAFQAAKSTDLSEREFIASAPKPGQAKRRGRQVQLRPNWDEMRDGVMLQLLRQKFLGDEELRRKLLRTGDAMLVEGNYWGDTYWGVCFGSGKNMLGKLLMQVREELRKGK